MEADNTSYLLYVKALIRLLLILFILVSSVQITVSWASGLCLLALGGSYYFFKSEDNSSSRTSAQKKVKSDDWSWNFLLTNPFKGKMGPGFLTEKEEIDIAKKVSNSVLYDAGAVQSLRNFDVIKKNTECVFAKRSRAWGSPSYDYNLTLEENIKGLIPTFYKFTLAFQPLRLDAFLIELPGSLYGTDIQALSKAVRTVLLTLREHDLKLRRAAVNARADFDEPTRKSQLELLVEHPERWDRRNWVFEFNRVTFFITSFAPFYPEENSRYSFGCADCYMLFQPEMSFALHDLPPDTAETNWECPVNVRDRIRVAFREAGREYEAPMKVKEPMVYEIVKRVHPQDDVIKWWEGSS
ncbi:uncharacterized protein LOC101859301 [Aplysia californica]|uniref:Uncharacterized protein LOC101859301 n=1 Tax=Aplysia californica TaxID=6500 RepID=A0ABM0KAI3_APLCA|nr:uncharacterized protein LOC101859301 [Aplysia californica]